jgi:hypothetical protein
VGNQALELLLPAGLVLLSRAKSSTTEWCFLKPRQEIRLQAPTTLRLGSPVLAVQCTILLQPTPRKQALELPLPEGLVPLCLQQLPWLHLAQHQQASLKAHVACGLVSPTPATAAMAPGSPCPNVSRPQGLCYLLGTRQFKPTSFAAPQVP